MARNDCYLSITPWTHIFGCFSLCRTGIHGVQIVSLSKFDEKVYLECIEVSGLPTIAHDSLKTKFLLEISSDGIDCGSSTDGTFS